MATQDIRHRILNMYASDRLSAEQMYQLIEVTWLVDEFVLAKRLDPKNLENPRR